MKIAMVSEHASPLAVVGGVHDGVVYTRRDDPDLPHCGPLDDGVRVVHLDAGPARPVGKDELLPHMARFTDELDRNVRRDPPELIHGHFWMSGLAASGPPWRLDRLAGAVSSGSPRPPGSHGPLSERA